MAKINTDEQKIHNILTRGVTEVIEREHLEAALKSGKKQLRVKLGFDPTGSQIHIGRAIVLRKLRAFQDLGHKIVFIVGDFTAQIGDPSDKLNKRPMLSPKDIASNLKNYKAQVGKVLDLKKAEFHFNSKWLKKLNFTKIAQLAESFTVGQMLARRNFKERFERGEEISTREFMYPLMQGYDSVMVRADVELGGFDQLFNLTAGRTIQSHYKQNPQDILTTEMLEGTDGRKMSTSWGNVINLTDEPNDMFGRVMSLKDELINRYALLCTDWTEEEIASLPTNPKEQKLMLASKLVKMYHSEKLAVSAQAEFERVFSKGQLPTEVPEVKVEDDGLSLYELLVKIDLATSNSDARRLIEQGAVKLNDEKHTDPNETIAITEALLVQVGPRRFVRIKK